MNRLLFLVLLILSCTAVAGRAQELTVRTRTVQEVEMGKFEVLDLGYDEEQFSMLPPYDWRAQIDSTAGTIRFSSRKGVMLAIQFSRGDSGRVLATTETLRQAIVPFLADATVLEEFPAYSGDSRGKGVDLSFTLQGSDMRSRAAVIPTAHGYVSFVLTCGKDDFKIGQQHFGAVLTSFQRTSKSSASK